MTALGLEGILMARVREGAKPNAGLPHPPALTKAAEEWTESLDAWRLVALHSICSQSKSFLVGYGMLDSMASAAGGSDGEGPPALPFAGISSAAEASRVEEECQISLWGMVEGGHDYDRLNCSIQLHSAHLFAKTILLENH